MRLFIVIFFLTPLFTVAQNDTLQPMDATTGNYYIYDSRARINFFKYPDSTYYYGEKCYALAKQKNNLFGIIDAQNLIAYSYYLKGNYSQAIEIFLATLKMTEPVKDSKIKKSCLAETYDGLGCTYCEAGLFDLGLGYLYKSKNAAIELKNQYFIASEITGIAIYYEKNNQLDSAEFYIKQGLALCDASGDNFQRPLLLYSLGNCKMKSGSPDKAISLWKETTRYANTDNLAAGMAFRQLGKYWLDKNLYDSTYYNAKNAIYLATKANNIENLYQANDLLLDLFKKTKKADSINYYLEVCYNLKDSVGKIAKTKQLQALLINEQYRQQNLLENEVKYTNAVTRAILGGIATALILLAVFQFRNNKQKQKANALLKQQKQKVESTLAELEKTQAQLIQSEKTASLGRVQQAISGERLRISRELHDEVGATLSGIAMYSHLTKEQIKNAQAAEVDKSLNIMQQSAGEMVNKLNDIVWLINPGEDSLQKLVQRLEEFTKDMAAVKNMEVKVTVPDHFINESLSIEIRRNIYLICKEAINNAVKYSCATLLELVVKECDKTLEFYVIDNGKGFNNEMIKRGNGLNNMQQRANEIGATLSVSSKPGQGVVVSMRLIFA